MSRGRAATIGTLRAVARPRRPRNRAARAARYLGLFAWFGGTAMGLALERRPGSHGALADDAWRRWDPVARCAVVSHVLGSAALGWAGRHRAWAQRGMPTAMALDTAATTVGIGADVVARRRSRTMGPGAPAGDRRAVRVARWLTLLGAGGSIAAQGYLAEQQRPLRTVRRARV